VPVFSFFGGKRRGGKAAPSAPAPDRKQTGGASEAPSGPPQAGGRRRRLPSVSVRRPELPPPREPWWLRLLRWSEAPWWVKTAVIIGLVGIGFAVWFAVGRGESPEMTYYISTRVAPEGSGQVLCDQGTESGYPAGTQITLTAVPAPDYEFIGWSGDISGASPEIAVTMDGNRDVTARFDIIRCELATSVNPPGGGTIIAAAGSYDVGTKVTLRASPASGYEFVGWSGDITGASPEITVTLDADKTVVATFGAIQYELLTMVTPAGGGEITPAGGLYDSGDRVALMAVAAPDYEFTGWSGDVTGSSPEIVVTMDDTKTVTANFSSTFQTIEYNMPVGISASVVVFSNEVKRGDIIEGYVELTGEFLAQDRSFDWSFEILNDEGRTADIFRGHWVESNHHDFRQEVMYSGTYRIRVHHNSLFDKLLIIRIKPQGWHQ